MLIGILSTFLILFGGGSGGFSYDTFRDVIGDTIEEKDRRADLYIEIDRAHDVLARFRDEVDDAAGDLIEFDEDFEANRSEYAALAGRIDRRRMEALRALLDARFALVERLSEEEWNSMYEEAAGRARAERTKRSSKSPLFAE
jgi:hypothetical protein